ncbi:MAG: hypothetical protein IPM82_28555, partial [Saprospiraceae bacterium]|nr:hypothetical protein [Saprospiraceae bacterium]
MALNPNEFGTRVIPNCQVVVDRNERRILSSEEWRKKFSYNTEEFLISDTNFKIVRERKANFEANNDTIEEKLVNQETVDVYIIQEVLDSHKDKRKSVYERYLENEENKRKQRK